MTETKVSTTRSVAAVGQDRQFKLSKINDEVVKPIKPLKEPDLRPVKGAKLFGECNASIFICASRGSGKTSVVGKAMKDCVGRDTKIYVFCANLDKDKSWIALQDYFENAGYDFTGFTSITDPESGENMLEALNYEIQERAREEREESRRNVADDLAEGKASKGVMQELWGKMFGSVLADGRQVTDGEDNLSSPNISGRRPRPAKYRAPEYMIVFDDLSDEIRNSREVAKLLKNGRHFAEVIISSQYLKDLRPEARTNIDYFILFKGLDKKTLEEVFRNAKLSVNFPTFEALYKDATREKYSFLYIDTRENKFRKRFSEQYEAGS